MAATQLDRARTIARWLHHVLAKADPSSAEKIAKAAHHAGETWLAPHRDLRSGPWLTRAQVAELGHVSPAAVSQWTSRGIPSAGRHVKLIRYPEGYDEVEAMDFIALRNTIPAQRKADQ